MSDQREIILDLLTMIGISCNTCKKALYIEPLPKNIIVGNLDCIIKITDVIKEALQIHPASGG